MMTTDCRLFVSAGLDAERESAARRAEGRNEKAKNDQQRTEAREETVLAGVHVFIVRGVGWEGIVFWGEEVWMRQGRFECEVFNRVGRGLDLIWEDLSHLRRLSCRLRQTQRLRAGLMCFAPPALRLFGQRRAGFARIRLWRRGRGWRSCRRGRFGLCRAGTRCPGWLCAGSRVRFPAGRVRGCNAGEGLFLRRCL
jgi:hypothetical protein